MANRIQRENFAPVVPLCPLRAPSFLSYRRCCSAVCTTRCGGKSGEEYKKRIEGAKNEHVKTKHVFQMKISTYTIMYQKKKTDIDTHTIMYQAKFPAIDIETIMYPAKFAAIDIETIMYPANFAGGRSRLDLLLPSFLPSREEKKKQERRKQSIDNDAEWHTPHMDRVRIETKKQDRIFCPLRGHSVGRMRYNPTNFRQEALFPINSWEERTETKMQERIKQSIDSGAEWHTPFMRQGERDAVWRDTFLEQRARVAIWRDRCLEEKYSHASLQLSTFGENSKPYKSSLVALSEQLRDIFAA